LTECVNAPARTREQIARLEATDLAKLRTSSGPVNATLTQSEERDSLVRRERDENYAAEQAQRVLRQVDLDIKSRTIGLRFLAMRREEFVNGALLEAGAGLAEAYRAQVAEMRKIVLQLWGLSTATGKTWRLSRYGHEVQLAHFEFDGWDDAETKIAADQNAIEAAAAPWRAVGEAWLRDPKRNPAVLYEAAKKGTTR
jgi:hypothetical protein